MLLKYFIIFPFNWKLLDSNLPTPTYCKGKKKLSPYYEKGYEKKFISNIVVIFLISNIVVIYLFFFLWKVTLLLFVNILHLLYYFIFLLPSILLRW
jgi:hypothetical protein